MLLRTQFATQQFRGVNCFPKFWAHFNEARSNLRDFWRTDSKFKKTMILNMARNKCVTLPLYFATILPVFLCIGKNHGRIVLVICFIWLILWRIKKEQLIVALVVFFYIAAANSIAWFGLENRIVSSKMSRFNSSLGKLSNSISNPNGESATG